MKYLLIIFCWTLSIFYKTDSLAQSAPFDTLSIHFDIGKSHIKPSQKILLDSISSLIQTNNAKLLIYGYADYLGTGKPNYSLSLQRAQMVESYLKSKGIPHQNFLQVSGEGKVDIRGKESIGNTSFRRVDIYIRNPNKKNNAPPLVDSFTHKILSLEVGKSMIIEDINFHYNSSKLIGFNIELLDELVSIMKANPAMRIAIEGHVCCIDPPHDAWDEDYEDEHLSKNRAKTVRDYLVQKGIDADRIKYLGHGMRKPLVYPEKDAKDRDANRRVEIRILKPQQ